jgi:DNA invertase Pin-like site-specific DNA recombinase
MPKAVCYVRVSHAKQGLTDKDAQREFDISIQTQVERCRAYHAYRLAPQGVTLYDRVLADVQVSGRDVDLSTAAGKLVAGVMAVVAQGQSDALSERNKAVAAELRRQNRPTNKNAPCGWRIAGPKGRRYLVPDERDRRVMAEIARLHDEEGLGFVRISDIIRKRAKAAYSTAREYSMDSKGCWWTWGPQKCWHQYNNWKKILAREVAKPPENGNGDGDLCGA